MENNWLFVCIIKKKHLSPLRSQMTTGSESAPNCGVHEIQD